MRLSSAQVRGNMKRSTIYGFFMIGAIAGGQWVEKNTSFSGLIIVAVAAAFIIALSFMSHIRPRYRRKKWRPRVVGQNRQSYDTRTRWNGWHQPKEQQYPAWAVYAAAAVLMVSTFCAVFFWPNGDPSEAASIATSASPANSTFEAPSKKAFVGSPVRSEAPRRVMEAEPSIAEIPADRFLCNVSSITDGDTLRCSDGTRVRLHAVAARESDETCKPGHPCPSASAASATAMLSSLASGQTLQCEQTGTSYNRVTAVCWNQQNTEINCAMVNSGTTVVWPKFNQRRSICQ